MWDTAQQAFPHAPSHPVTHTLQRRKWRLGGVKCSAPGLPTPDAVVPSDLGPACRPHTKALVTHCSPGFQYRAPREWDLTQLEA